MRNFKNADKMFHALSTSCLASFTNGMFVLPERAMDVGLVS